MARSLKIFALSNHIETWSGIVSLCLKELDSRIELLPTALTILEDLPTLLKQIDQFEKTVRENNNAKTIVIMEKTQKTYHGTAAIALDHAAADLVDSNIPVARISFSSLPNDYGQCSRDWIGEYSFPETEFETVAQELHLAFAKIK